MVKKIEKIPVKKVEWVNNQPQVQMDESWDIGKILALLVVRTNELIEAVNHLQNLQDIQRQTFMRDLSDKKEKE